MSLIARALRPSAPAPSAPMGLAERSGAYIDPILGATSWLYQTSSGEYIDVQTALRSAAVAACRRVLVSSIMSMPAHSYQRQGLRGKMLRHDTDASVVAKPSMVLKKRAWLAQIANGLILDGNVYAIGHTFNAQGYPTYLEPIPRQAVSWVKDDSGVPHPWYKGAQHKLFPYGDFFFQQATPFLRTGEIEADSPVDLAKESIGTGLAAERFGAQFFRDGAHPSGIVTADRTLTPEEAIGVKRAIYNALRGNREAAVLGSGYKYESVEINPDDSQFIDLMRFEIEQACRFFGVPPSMAYASVSGQAVTYVNIAQSDLQFLKHSLRSWVDDIEDLWSSAMPAPQGVKLTPEGLIKMDPDSRHKLYKTRLESRTITVNEIRELEDEPRIEILNADGVNEYDMPGIPAGVTLAEVLPEPPAEDPDNPEEGAKSNE